jgi:hypothetical protein
LCFHAANARPEMPIANPSPPAVAEAILHRFSGKHPFPFFRFSRDQLAVRRLGALRDDDQRKVLSSAFALEDLLANVFGKRSQFLRKVL